MLFIATLNCSHFTKLNIFRYVPPPERVEVTSVLEKKESRFSRKINLLGDVLQTISYVGTPDVFEVKHGTSSKKLNVLNFLWIIQFNRLFNSTDYS